MKRRKVIVKVLMPAMLFALLLIYLWAGPYDRRFAVTNNGPLDIRLWGIRPNAGDIIYDPNGSEIRRTFGFARENRYWKEDSQRFDFIFELPETDELPLFRKFPRLEPSGEGRKLGASFDQWITDYEGKRLLWYRISFPGTFKRPVLRGLWASESDVDSVDMTLEYYHGQAGKSLFTLRGPFKLNSKVSSADGLYNVAFTNDSASQTVSYTEFVLTTSNRSDSVDPVVVYDQSGGRHLAGTARATSNRQGWRIQYALRGIPLRKISAIAFGEQPYRTTFKNLNLDAPGVERCRYAPYLEEMANRLNLKLDPEKLENYEFEEANDALDVIDIVRGRHIPLAAEAILDEGRSRDKRSVPPTLTDEQEKKLKQALSRWLKAWDPRFRGWAIQLGLFYDWPEFVEPALELLETDAIHYYYEMQSALNGTAYALERYSEKLTDEAIGRIGEILLSRDDKNILNALRECLDWPKSQAKIDTLLALAEDERPWLWWDAIGNLVQWGEFRGKEDSLPDKLKIRLFAMTGAHGFSNPEQIAPRANDLLDGLLTPQLLAFDALTFGHIFQRIARNPDRSFATAALVNFLRRIEDYDRSIFYSVDRTVKYINLWHGLDIGGLGNDVNRQTFELHKYNWSEITAEAIEWYEKRQNAKDANSASQ